MHQQSAQKGIVAHPVLIAAAIIGLLIIFLYAIGALKFDLTVKKSSQGTSSSATTSQSKTYQNDQVGISLNFPASWRYQEKPNKDTVVGFLSPLGKDDQFAENVIVRIVDLSSNPSLTLQEGVDLWIEQTKGSYSTGDFAVVSQAPATVASMPARRVVFLLKDQGIEGKGMATITIQNNTAYIFVYLAETKSFDKFLSDANSIVASLKIK
ncbi:hypothetical protein HY388_00455 [Candidatus Daviesbacteria bacterium]|nr:hypothetical protein [Candidatus Daviesbacteria bacterium]